MKARSVDCECNSRFTCGHCLRNAPPYLFNGVPIPRVQGGTKPAVSTDMTTELTTSKDRD